MDITMLFAASQIITLLVVGSIFVGVSAVAWLVVSHLNGGEDSVRAEARLAQLQGKSQSSADASSRMQGLADMINKAAPIAKSIQPKDEATQGKLKSRLVQAGFRGNGASTTFLTIKMLGAIAGLVLGGIYGLYANGISMPGLYKPLIFGGFGFFIPELALSFLISRRKQEIFLGLPDALDLMVVCVEAGLGLDQAMRKVAVEMTKTYKSIAEEFAVSNAQLQLGRPRNEVLKLLGNRSDVDELKALASILIQADKFGSSIAQALRVQSDAMRIRRRQIAEEKAAKSAVKLIFPLVLFIFPGIFAVLVGPAAIAMINQDSF